MPAPPTMQVTWIGPGRQREVLAAGHGFDEPPDERAARACPSDDREYLLIAYLADGTPVGLARATALRRLDSPARKLFPYEVAVAPEHSELRRRGRRAALARTLVRICKAEGVAEPIVLTHRSTRAAMHRYASTGTHRLVRVDRCARRGRRRAGLRLDVPRRRRGLAGAPSALGPAYMWILMRVPSGAQSNTSLAFSSDSPTQPLLDGVPKPPRQ